MSDRPVTLQPGWRLGRDGKPYDFEKWKREKIEKGEWYDDIDEFKKMKKKEREENIIKKAIDKGKVSPVEPENDRKRKSSLEIYRDREEKVLKLADETNETPYDSLVNRVIIFDTETTGIKNDDEIVEISLIETVDGIKTGRHLHFFVNPIAPITKKAFEIHQLTKEKLEEHPRFEQVAHTILGFIGTSSLLAHNAKFDMKMLNRGFIRAGINPFPPERFLCSCLMARFLFPGEKNSQDALCSRFEIDNFNRVTTGIHSAIEDTAQLYHIYVNLCKLLNEKNVDQSNFRLPPGSSLV